MIRFADLKLDEVIFTHFNPETGAQTHYAVDRLTAWCKEHLLPTVIPVTKADAAIISSVRGLEAHRFDRLTGEHLIIPMLMCQQEDGSWLLVDGNHRYVKIALVVGHNQALAYMVRQDEWEDFVIKDYPPQSLSIVDSFSGIK